MKNTFPFIWIFLLISCAATPKAKTIIEIDPNMTTDCTFLQSVHGHSAWGDTCIFTFGLTNAKNQALNRAAELGATHIVWTNLRSGLGGANVSGRAYRCH